LVEGDDNIALAQHVAECTNFLELKITPVIEDEEAASALSKAYST
jgi:hypothetical protein